MVIKNKIKLISFEMDFDKIKTKNHITLFFKAIQRFKNSILIFPELFPFTRKIETALLKRISSKTGNLIFFGFSTKSNEYCCVYGNKFLKHSKSVLFADEKKKFKRGNTLDLIKFKGLAIAPLICYELYFPQIASSLFDKNIDLIIYPTMIPLGRENFVSSLMQVRSAELGCDIISSTIGTNYSLQRNMIFRGGFPLQAKTRNLFFGVSYIQYTLKKRHKLKSSPYKKGSVLFKERLYGPFVEDFTKPIRVLIKKLD